MATLAHREGSNPILTRLIAIMEAMNVVNPV